MSINRGKGEVRSMKSAILMIFSKYHQIEFRLMRSRRNDLIRMVPATKRSEIG